MRAIIHDKENELNIENILYTYLVVACAFKDKNEKQKISKSVFNTESKGVICHCSLLIIGIYN